MFPSISWKKNGIVINTLLKMLLSSKFNLRCKSSICTRHFVLISNKKNLKYFVLLWHNTTIDIPVRVHTSKLGGVSFDQPFYFWYAKCNWNVWFHKTDEWITIIIMIINEYYWLLCCFSKLTNPSWFSVKSIACNQKSFLAITFLYFIEFWNCNQIFVQHSLE